MATSNVIDFDFNAAIAKKNRFARRPVEPRRESPVDLATAKALSEGDTELSLQDVRLLIAVEKTDYRAYLSHLTALPETPERSAQSISYEDTQILNAVSVWTQYLQSIAIFSCYSKTDFSEVCSLGIRLLGSGLESEDTFMRQSAYQAKRIEKAMLRQVADFCPTHIIMSTPNQRLLNWANRHRISSIVLVDDWQAPLGRQQRQQHKRLVKLLNRPQVKWIGSRGLSACQAMARSGVATSKLIPWEWPQPHLLSQHLPKAIDDGKDRVQMLYSGTLDSSSRVGDLLAALSLLKQRSYQAELQIAIDEATPESLLDSLVLQSQRLEVTEAITLVFAQSIEQLLTQVRAADVVVIPGGLPGGTGSNAEPPLLIQVARAACTPVVACDRADFEPYLTHGGNAMIFPEGNEKSMVHRIERLMGQPQLYAQLSESGIAAQWQKDAPANWKELCEQWIRDRPVNREWLRSYAFSSNRYQLDPVA